MNFIKKNWLNETLHLLFPFQILLTLPYRDHPNLSNPHRRGRIKNLDPFTRTVFPKGFCHWQMKFSSQLRVRDISRKMGLWFTLLLPLQQIQLASQQSAGNGLQRKQPVGLYECVTVRAIKPCSFPFPFKSLARTCFPHIACIAW